MARGKLQTWLKIEGDHSIIDIRQSGKFRALLQLSVAKKEKKNNKIKKEEEKQIKKKENKSVLV